MLDTKSYMKKKFFEIPADLDSRFKLWCSDHKMTQREAFMLAVENLIQGKQQKKKKN